MRRTFVLVATLLGLMVSGFAAAAQEATPVPTVDGECTVEPRPIEFFEQFVGTPVPVDPEAEVAPPDAATPPFAIAGPAPADPAVAPAVEATVQELVACLNEGDFLRAFALFSDAWFERLVEQEGPLTEEELDFLATEMPLPPEEQVVLIAVHSVHVLPDDRIGALVDTTDPLFAPDEITTDLFVFVEEDGRYLVDDVLEFADPDAATPAP